MYRISLLILALVAHSALSELAHPVNLANVELNPIANGYHLKVVHSDTSVLELNVQKGVTGQYQLHARLNYRRNTAVLTKDYNNNNWKRNNWERTAPAQNVSIDSPQNDPLQNNPPQSEPVQIIAPQNDIPQEILPEGYRTQNDRPQIVT